MPHPLYRYELRIHAPIDPISAVSRLARSATFDKFVVYEHNGTWTFAGGATGEIVLDHEGFRVRWPDSEHRLPFPADPARELAQILDHAPVADWSLFGWTSFEYAYAQAGLTDLIGACMLAHLVVPQVEIALRADGVVLRGGDRRMLDVLADAVVLPPAEPTVLPVSCALDESGCEEYRAAVLAVIADIRDKRLSKAVVSRIVPVELDIDLVSTYVAGRRGNTPSRSFLFRLGELAAAGFSPETVVEVAPDGTVVSHPLAGTRALYLDDPARSAALRADLLTDPKEVFEHAISVQLAYEELKRICVSGTVQIDGFMQVAERGSVQHLASVVGGRLKNGRGPWDAFATLFPAVTVSGVPKLAAYQAIHAYESGPRGLYSGSVLAVDSCGRLDAALALRTVFQRNGRTWLQAGAGIVANSTPEREFEETCEKLRSVARFLVPADPAAAPGTERTGDELGTDRNRALGNPRLDTRS
ncbi:MAG: salicylate synthase [Pseudonocardiaceae bacterium]